MSKYNRISDYAKTNDIEDFAEYIASFVIEKEWFEKSFPNRAKLLREIAKKQAERIIDKHSIH